MKVDNDGNMIILEVEIENRFIINLINIYGPNNDSSEFYTNISEIIYNSEIDFTIICGDYNLVQDFELDCMNYRHLHNPRARQELLNLKNIHNLHDPWRLYYPKLQQFTDHSCIDLDLKFSQFVKGRGFWKFNSSLLKDITYVEKVKQTIDTVKLKYATPVYNLENMNNIPIREIQFIIDDHSIFEQILLEIRSMTISFSTHRKKELELEEKILLCGFKC